mmetsp:Transcript_29593/g.114160  ORF Transcript_29593/g.114160 Transcript_29593/m.114160 type:complete len:91 (-) Transcript_29593:215-487(-)
MDAERMKRKRKGHDSDVNSFASNAVARGNSSDVDGASFWYPTQPPTTLHTRGYSCCFKFLSAPLPPDAVLQQLRFFGAEIMPLCPEYGQC